MGPDSAPWVWDSLYQPSVHVSGAAIRVPLSNAQVWHSTSQCQSNARDDAAVMPWHTQQPCSGQDSVAFGRPWAADAVMPWHAQQPCSGQDKVTFGSARDATDTLGRPWAAAASLSPPILHVPQLPLSGLTPTPPITPIAPSPIVQARNTYQPALRADAALPEHGDAHDSAVEFPLYTYREEIIKGRRWPLYVKHINGSGESATLVLSKGHHSDYHGRSEFQFTVDEVRRLTLPSTSTYYTTVRASESVAEIARKHGLSARDLVNMNLRLENISVSSKLKVGTHLCVAGIVD